jgi:transcriptional regulator with XRE-family HTH domain
VAIGQRRTADRIQVGATVKRMRLEAGRTRDEAAAALGCTVMTVANIEQGRTKIGQSALGTLLDLYAVSGEEAADLLEVNRAARRSLPRVAGGAAIQPHQRRAADLIGSARGMRYYSPEVFPGLLQTEGYARAILAPSGHVGDILAARLKFRLTLADVLTCPEPLRFSVVVGEAALHKNIGGPAVMREQLRHVAELCRTRSNVVVQVLPLNAREHELAGATVTIYTFGPKVPEIASVDTTIGEQFFDRDTSVAEAIMKFDDVRVKALDPLTSVDMLEELSRRP